MQHSLKDISAALFELRDALTHLSVTLKDYQFETDLVQRNDTQAMVRQLLQNMTLAPGPSA